MDYSQLENYLNELAQKYLSMIKSQFGESFNEEQNNYLNSLMTKRIIKVESDSSEYVRNQGENFSGVPLAHGARVFEDDNIHFYPEVVSNKDEIKNKCEELLVHELFHYFIRPTYMNSIDEDLEGINSFVTEGIVDMFARDFHKENGINDKYSSLYADNVMFIRRLGLDKKDLLNLSVEDIIKKTTKEDCVSSMKHERNFNKLLSDIASHTAMIVDPTKAEAIYRNFLNKAANYENEKDVLEALKQYIVYEKQFTELESYMNETIEDTTVKM